MVLHLNILNLICSSCADSNPLVFFFEGKPILLAEITGCFTFNVNKEQFFYLRVAQFLMLTKSLHNCKTLFGLSFIDSLCDH